METMKIPLSNKKSSGCVALRVLDIFHFEFLLTCLILLFFYGKISKNAFLTRFSSRFYFSKLDWILKKSTKIHNIEFCLTSYCVPFRLGLISVNLQILTNFKKFNFKKISVYFDVSLLWEFSRYPLTFIGVSLNGISVYLENEQNILLAKR
jgi:hypothetical protein